MRRTRTDDHGALVECVQSWWGESRTPEQARELSMLLPRLDRVCFRRLLDPA
jgi:hypothetical protein